MKRTTAPGSVSGLHVDRNVGSGNPGSYGIAEDRNNLQEEICHSIEDTGIVLDGTDQYQLEKALIALSMPVGTAFDVYGDLTPVSLSNARSSAHPGYPKYLPILRIDNIVASAVIADANYPDLCPLLRAAKFIPQTVSGTSDFTATVAGSVLTFSAGAALDALIAWITLGETAGWGGFMVAGTIYSIAGTNAPARQLTVAGVPPSGIQTCSYNRYSIPGSSITARILPEAPATVGKRRYVFVGRLL
jgi:hypothetical protein